MVSRVVVGANREGRRRGGRTDEPQGCQRTGSTGMTARSAFRLTRRMYECRLRSQPGRTAIAVCRRSDGTRFAPPSLSPATGSSGSSQAAPGSPGYVDPKRTLGAAAAGAKVSGSEPRCRRGHRWLSCSFCAFSSLGPRVSFGGHRPRGASLGGDAVANRERHRPCPVPLLRKLNGSSGSPLRQPWAARLLCVYLTRALVSRRHGVRVDSRGGRRSCRLTVSPRG